MMRKRFLNLEEIKNILCGDPALFFRGIHFVSGRQVLFCCYYVFLYSACEAIADFFFKVRGIVGDAVVWRNYLNARFEYFR